jgi:hypothetical protein
LPNETRSAPPTCDSVGRRCKVVAVAGDVGAAEVSMQQSIVERLAEIPLTACGALDHMDVNRRQCADALDQVSEKREGVTGER